MTGHKPMLGLIAFLAAIVLPLVSFHILGKYITLENAEQIPLWLYLGIILTSIALGGILAIIAAFLNRRWLRYGSMVLIVIYAVWLVRSIVIVVLRG